MQIFVIFFCGALLMAILPTRAAVPDDLVKNGSFSQVDPATRGPLSFMLTGKAQYRYLGIPNLDASSQGVALNSTGGGAAPVAAVSQLVSLPPGVRQLQFSCRGLAQEQLLLDGQTLRMRIEYLAGNIPVDGKSKVLDPEILQDRHDLNRNGDGNTGGAAVWRTYTLQIDLPLGNIDHVRLDIELDKALSRTNADSAFYISQITLMPLTAIAPTTLPSTRPDSTAKPQGHLISLGGRWYYLASTEHPTPPAQFDHTNVNTLYYHDAEWTTPFEGSVSAVLRAGDKDERGNVVSEDRMLDDNVTIQFQSESLVLHTHGIPNHPTGKFPELANVPWFDPSYITERQASYYLPVNPKVNAAHVVTTKDNSNHALNMGPIGIALNGVVFYNPFDATSQDASNIMDRCCGHPDPSGLYHYHKYPICINSPWDDKGLEHSALIGFAFDGFPIYGPYESAGVLAMSVRGEHALNSFNLHFDPERSWHYHVTPGMFPYIIGGYWGQVDQRDVNRLGPPRGMGGNGPRQNGPPGGGPPPARRPGGPPPGGPPFGGPPPS